MSMMEFEFVTSRRKPTPVRARDLAAAWLAAAAVIASLIVLPGSRRAEHSSPAPAAIVMPSEDPAPDGVGQVRKGIETCSVRDWADERC